MTAFDKTPLWGRIASLWLLIVTSGTATASENPLAWRDAPNLASLVQNLDDWLDAHSDLPAAKRHPIIRTTDEMTARSKIGQDLHASTGGRPRGFYERDAETIWLVRPWDARDPRDVSVLLHEIVHHRQASRHFYCEGAKELPAYTLQRDWLAALGLQPDVNWIAVVLESGCTPRDIHPD